MPEQAKLEQAKLLEVDLATGDQDAKVTDGGVSTAVQFNPETLRLTYANTVDKPEASGSAAMQYIASSSTKLDVELWFDVSVVEGQTDVRTYTEKVHFFITPKKAKKGPKFVVPGVRFQWGSFVFDGVVTTLNESLEMFSQDGRPLRSKIGLSFSAQNIKFKILGLSGDSTGGGGVGQQPQVSVKQGDSLQQTAAKGGDPGSWKALAAANKIENPRLPQVSALLGIKGS